MFKVSAMFAVMFALLMVIAVMPQQAKAASLTPQQIEAVTNLLVSFNVDAQTVTTVKAVLNGTGGPGPGDNWKQENGNQMGGNRNDDREDHFKTEFPGASACGFLNRSLTRGNVGDDVRKLQEFLRQTGDLHATSTTNFFGAVTEAALQAWQARTGLVLSGSADTTGFGKAGPLTRQALMMHCKQLIGAKEGNNPGGPFGDNHGSSTNDSNVLSCRLTASKTTIAVGESVTLYWTSKNATSSSTIGGGTNGAIAGSLQLMPTETTTYLKRVFGPAGQAECMTTVTVGTTTPAVEKKVVVVPTVLNIGRTLTLMTSGMAAVMDGYLSLFGMSLE
jgi:peptidoglycan hydrolase-like protein with peptidoglycan-binding domain